MTKAWPSGRIIAPREVTGQSVVLAPGVGTGDGGGVVKRMVAVLTLNPHCFFGNVEFSQELWQLILEYQGLMIPNLFASILQSIQCWRVLCQRLI